MECSTVSENMSSDRKKAIEKLIEGRDSATQLQILLQNKKPLDVLEMAKAEAFVMKIIGSFPNAISVMSSDVNAMDMCQSPMTAEATSTFTDDGKCVDPNDRRKISAVKDRRGGYKRRKNVNSWITTSPKPIDDGHAWRKYGQKEILSSKFPRNYFRCTHKTDQGCQAMKQVQQTEDDPPMYKITYIGHHTCTDPLKSPQLILDHSPSPSTNSHNLFNVESTFATGPNKDDYRPFFDSFPSFKLENKLDNLPSNQNQSSSSNQYNIVSPDLTTLESSGPPTMLASSSGSDYGDVVSGVYSCTTSSKKSDLADWIQFLDDGLVFSSDDQEFQDVLFC
ncbi:hypothetical protein IFM89_031964 [Coptis chinensis]|uniref:WRKY domain-containing protein n=1 Tax=Coptis chinensis TaxID=261450 RepID=A0A835HGA6_9MAGN|nr:hypothetical protein IFM89_031964 [Coptis chinensis]